MFRSLSRHIKTSATVILAGSLLVLTLTGCGGGGGGSDTTSDIGGGGGGAVTPPPTGNFSVSLVASRTSGVAPLAVFFDATGSTDPATTSHPFHDLQYVWDFGDTNSGNWRPTDGSNQGRSRNYAAGPVAAHVFETPGTYTIKVAVFNGSTQVEKTLQVSVSDPETAFASPNTYCFSTTSDFTGCPDSVQTAQRITTSSFTTAISAYQGAGRRLLFKRGDTFNAPSQVVLTTSGPGVVGAFGSGAAPLIESGISDNGALLALSSPSTPSFADWRIMDLQIDGNRQTGTCIDMAGGGDNILMLRLEIHHCRTGIGFNYEVLDYLPNNHHLFDGIFVVDSNLHHMVQVGADDGAYGAYIGARRLGWLGNIIDDTADLPNRGSHNLRLTVVDRGVISNSIFRNPWPSRLCLKLHSACFGNRPGATDVCVYRNVVGYQYSENIVISDNEFKNNDDGVYTVDIGPQNGNADERIRQFIFERNWFRGSTRRGLAVDLRLSATEGTVRNNAFTSSDASGTDYVSVQLVREGIEPPPAAIRVYNNSSYSATPTIYSTVLISPEASDITVRNNLSYAPSAVNSTVVRNEGATNVVASNNSTDAQVRNTAPGWSTQPPTLPAHMQLGTGSYARNAGASVPVYLDYFLSARPQGTIDLGAAEVP